MFMYDLGANYFCSTKFDSFVFLLTRVNIFKDHCRGFVETKSILLGFYMGGSLNGGTPKTPQNDHF